MIISFLNGKGGVGKTTVCLLIALALRAGGKKITIHDLDPQRSLNMWLQKNCPEVLNDPLAQYTLIDNAPRIDLVQNTIHADIIALVTRPYPLDLLAAKETADELRKLGVGRKIVVVFNQVRHGTKLDSALEDKAKFLGAPMIRTHLSVRICYASAATNIREGWELLSKEARDEVGAVTIELINQYKSINNK